MSALLQSNRQYLLDAVVSRSETLQAPCRLENLASYAASLELALGYVVRFGHEMVTLKVRGRLSLKIVV